MSYLAFNLSLVVVKHAAAGDAAEAQCPWRPGLEHIKLSTKSQFVVLGVVDNMRRSTLQKQRFNND